MRSLRGELWGLANLLKFSGDKVATRDLLAAYGRGKSTSGGGGGGGGEADAATDVTGNGADNHVSDAAVDESRQPQHQQAQHSSDESAHQDAGQTANNDGTSSINPQQLQIIELGEIGGFNPSGTQNKLEGVFGGDIEGDDGMADVNLPDGDLGGKQVKQRRGEEGVDAYDGDAGLGVLARELLTGVALKEGGGNTDSEHETGGEQYVEDLPAPAVGNIPPDSVPMEDVVTSLAAQGTVLHTHRHDKVK